MIDLRRTGLPNTIIVDGSPFKVKTSFRLWIEFGNLINKKDVTLGDLVFLFDVEDISQLPIGKNFYPQLVEFYINENATPSNDGTDSSERAIDYVLDGEYIYGSFMQAYHIDLTQCDLHWHQFKALLLCLPDDTKIKEIMSIRTWKKDNTKHETLALRAKQAWKLPEITTQEEQELLDEINREFYNS